MTGTEAAKKHTKVFGGFPHYCYFVTDEEDEYLTELVNKAIKRGRGLDHTDFDVPDDVIL